jgi:hypothetical protein
MPRASHRYLHRTVRIDGLKNRSELNGRLGTVLKLDEATGRLGVKVASTFRSLKHPGVKNRPLSWLLTLRVRA